MRYTESRERSAELLRIALGYMSQQSAAFHPLSYALWYEHVASVNPALSRVLDERLARGAALGETDVWRLYSQYILARDIEGFEHLQARLQDLLSHAARGAETASREAAQFNRALESHQAQLAQTHDLDQLHAIVGALIGEGRRLQESTCELSEKLEATAKEVQTLVERLEQAQSEALLDPLSGLKNRRGLDRALEAMGFGSSATGASLLLIDIDLFKTVNDSYGHLLGDKVIRAVAQVLQSCIKGRDIAARLGGEEFAVLLPGTPLDGATALAEQIRSAIAQGRIRRPDRDEYIGRVTVSVGVAAAYDGESLESLIQRADLAMYASKRAGRNRVTVAGATM